jgi:hypothetical protein
MSAEQTRRGFLLRVAAAAGLAGLAVLGITGRAALWTARRIRIPVKPFDRARLREPHDLAG